MTSTLNNDSLVKASFQRLLADLEFLHTNNMITNEAHATIHQTLEPTCHKLRIAKFFVTCTFTHEKKDAAQLHIQKGQVLEVLDDENTDWYMGGVRGEDGVVGWAPKNKFRVGE